MQHRHQHTMMPAGGGTDAPTGDSSSSSSSLAHRALVAPFHLASFLLGFLWAAFTQSFAWAESTTAWLAGALTGGTEARRLGCWGGWASGAAPGHAERAPKLDPRGPGGTAAQPPLTTLLVGGDSPHSPSPPRTHAQGAILITRLLVGAAPSRIKRVWPVAPLLLASAGKPTGGGESVGRRAAGDEEAQASLAGPLCRLPSSRFLEPAQASPHAHCLSCLLAPPRTQAVGLGGGYSLNVASAEAAPDEPSPQVRAVRGSSGAAPSVLGSAHSACSKQQLAPTLHCPPPSPCCSLSPCTRPPPLQRPVPRKPQQPPSSLRPRPRWRALPTGRRRSWRLRRRRLRQRGVRPWRPAPSLSSSPA